MAFNDIKLLLNHFVEDMKIPGCALEITHKGDVVFEHYAGLADVETKRPIDKNTVYRIYSDTKVVTAVAAMILLERGKFLLNDPIEKYLPEFSNPHYYRYEGTNVALKRPAVRSIQIVDLMRMTAGLPYGGEQNLTQCGFKNIGSTFPNEPMLLRDYIKKIAEVPLAFSPGEHWNYGFGMDVMGAIIEVLSGKPLNQFFEDEIFEPLGMKNTGFFFKNDMQENLTVQYELIDGKPTPYGTDHWYTGEYKCLMGGSGLLSTVEDMSTFASMLSMGGSLKGVRILSPKTVDLMRANHLEPHQLKEFQRVHTLTWTNMVGYGFGLGCRTLIDIAKSGANGSIGEFGWSGAAGTFMLIDPKEQIAAYYAEQIMPFERNLQDYVHPRVRNAIYGALT